MVTFELNKEEIDETIFCVENTESIQTIQLQAGVNAAVILLKPKTGIILLWKQNQIKGPIIYTYFIKYP